ncbi:MAG: Hpt domain-containing protein [Proteobacteria bacterium]|nr:Hpt domain-containing protein [Pseudomonadota bacterium]
MDPKLEKYRDSFIKEMNDRLEVLKEFVPKLKSRPANMKFVIEEIYRACHSIKGTAAFMGCADIADQIRPLEKYLYQIRASVTEGKDIREAIADVEFSPDRDDRGKIIGSLRELTDLLSQSAVDLERLVKKI